MHAFVGWFSSESVRDTLVGPSRTWNQFGRKFRSGFMRRLFGWALQNDCGPTSVALAADDLLKCGAPTREPLIELHGDIDGKGRIDAVARERVFGLHFDSYVQILVTAISTSGGAMNFNGVSPLPPIPCEPPWVFSGGTAE